MYAKHGKIVDADASGAKANTNTLNHVYRSFKVTHFGITEKLSRKNSELLPENIVGWSPVRLSGAYRVVQ